MLDLKLNKLNILASYAYMRNSPSYRKLILNLSEQGYINLLIDSGAFTAHNSGKPIDLNEYMEACKSFEGRCWQYVMLDVLRDNKQTIKNFDTMLSKGLNPMGVLTTDMLLDLVPHLLQKNVYIGVPGGTATKGDFIRKRFQDVYQLSNGKAKIHGLGYVKYPDMYQLPLYTVDSSTFAVGQMYGWLRTFTGKGGFDYKWHSADMKHAKASKVPNEVKRMWIQAGLSPSRRLDRDMYVGQNSFPNYTTVNAYIDMHEFSRLNGLHYFFVCGDISPVFVLSSLLHSRKKYGHYKFDDVKRDVVELTKLNKKGQAFDKLKEMLS